MTQPHASIQAIDLVGPALAWLALTKHTMHASTQVRKPSCWVTSLPDDPDNPLIITKDCGKAP
jgi:hypothetical protein